MQSPWRHLFFLSLFPQTIILAQLHWSPPMLIHQLPPQGGSVAMAVADGGDIAVVLGVSGFSSSLICCVRSTDAGVTWSDGAHDTVFQGYWGGGAGVTDLKFDHVGNLWMLWVSYDDFYGPPSIRLSKSTDLGASFTHVFASLGASLGGANGCLGIDEGNSVFLLWRPSGVSTTVSLMLTRFLNGQVSQRYDIIVPTDSLTTGKFSLAIGADSVLYCVWGRMVRRAGNENHTMLMASASFDLGASFSSTTQVDTSIVSTGFGSFQEYPCAGIDRQGNLYVVYEKNRVLGSEMRIAKSTNSGSSFLASVVVSDSMSGYDPDICIDSLGVNVLWPGPQAHMHSRSTDGGTTFSSPSIVGYGSGKMRCGVFGDLYAVLVPGSGAYFYKTDYVVSIPNEETGIGRFTMNQNFPNPFNPSTTIRFELPFSSHVRLEIFNALGQMVEMVRDERMTSGIHDVAWSPTSLPSGVYFYRLAAGNVLRSGKMLLLK